MMTTEAYGEPSDLIPGSFLAQQYGCTCREEQPEGASELLHIDCPIHGLLSDEAEHRRGETA